MNALNGILVLERATSLRGAYCGKLLRDCGADVVKIELPGAARFTGQDRWPDAGKTVVSFDPRTPTGVELLDRLASRVDVLIDDEPFAGDDRADSAAAVGERHPRLIVASITDLGRGGPWDDRPTTDLTVAALSGICSINGAAGQLPLREPGNQTAILAALTGFLGTLVALANRSLNGTGQRVDVSALEAVVNVLSPSVLQHSYRGQGPERSASAQGFLFRCADGQVSIILSADRSWQTLCDVWEVPVNRSDKRFTTQASRRVNIDAVRELLAPILAGKRRAEIFEQLSLVRVPCGMLLSPAELLQDPHLQSRGAFAPNDRGDGREAGRMVPAPGFRLLGADSKRDIRPKSPDELRALISSSGGV